MKSCRLLPGLRVAAWVGFHSRTHPVFFGQVLSAIYFSLESRYAIPSHPSRLLAPVNPVLRRVECEQVFFVINEVLR